MKAPTKASIKKNAGRRLVKRDAGSMAGKRAGKADMGHALPGKRKGG